MGNFIKNRKLKKELGLLDVYAIATGTTLSAGFFLLPGLAAELAGPAILLAYIIATIPLIPAMFSIVELSTAMPRAGGVYYFLDRSLGPFFGTIGGIGTWMALILKVTFSLIGMSAYIALFFPEAPIVPTAIVIALLLGILNLYSVKKSGRFQIMLVIGLLLILAVFIFGGVQEINFAHFNGFFDAGFKNILATSGLVYISYVGVTKIASLSEEVKNPERNLPLGIFLALGSAILIYAVGIYIMVGVLPIEQLKGGLTPVASAANIIFGAWGTVLLSVAALLAFISVANAGILSASRYPLAMSRDHIFQDIFRKLSKRGIPTLSILITVLIIVLILVFLDPLRIAKLASAFQLFMFALVCFAVIVMRESKIESYDPGYKSPFYPWMQIIGIFTAFWLIIEMGLLPIEFSLGLVVISILWYWFYAKKRVIRSGAIYHLFERLGRQRYEGLDAELRGILIEKGLRKDDPFEQVVASSKVFDISKEMLFEDVLEPVSKWLSRLMPLSPEEIKEQFLEGTRVGATPVTRGIALPHFRLDKVEQTEMVLVRSKPGVHITLIDPLTHKPEEEQIVNALFFLVSPENNPTQHLRILAQIAGRVDDNEFSTLWKNAETEQELKESLLRNEQFLSFTLRKGDSTESIINKSVKLFTLPENCLVVMINRNNKILIPKGDIIFREGDRITIIGEPKKIKELKKIYSGFFSFRTE